MVTLQTAVTISINNYNNCRHFLPFFLPLHSYGCVKYSKGIAKEYLQMRERERESKLNQ